MDQHSGNPADPADRRPNASGKDGAGKDGAGRIDLGTLGGESIDEGAGRLRLQAVVSVAQYHGIVLDPAEFRAAPGELTPSPASLVAWLRDNQLWAKAARLPWRQLLKLDAEGPVALLFTDGTAGLLVGADADRNVVLLQSPDAPRNAAPVAVDQLRLEQVWGGEVVLIRAQRGVSEADAPFGFGWIMRMILTEKKILRDISVASLTISFLTILPPLVVMAVINQVVVHHSMSTLAMLSLMIAVMGIYEMVLGSARRQLVLVIGTRLDAKLSLHVFNRMLRLSLDFFEINPAGDTTYKIAQIAKVREFLTGKMLNTFLDFFTLLVILPFLFWLDPTLSWLVLAASCMVALVILAFIQPMRVAAGRVVQAEIEKNSTLVETIHGIRTVKSLGLEGPRRTEWDERVARSGVARLAAGELANWPQTLIAPIERFIQSGIILIGAYLALTSPSAASIGSLMAFMMMGSRVAAPLIGVAKMLDDMEELRSSISRVKDVLNSPMETNAAGGGLRPKFAGGISFDGVTFTYPRAKVPALEKVTFEIAPGTMLGIVGRSGSGKSTITRLLQGINREYTGFLKIDGSDLREINLQHLRRSFGVVLQENFLFRGSVRDNIIGGRPGLTMDDVIRAARLAGAEEFIERMPQGYETFIQEGSPNLSGGQRQRLAIARAVIDDPRILILDEATSALDPESEALVNANLTRIGAGRTMVIVSHRLSSLTDCDQILVLDKGTVMDLAPHRTLLERCGIYRQLWAQQNRHLDTQQGPTRHAPPAPILVQGDD